MRAKRCEDETLIKEEKPGHLVLYNYYALYHRYSLFCLSTLCKVQYVISIYSCLSFLFKNHLYSWYFPQLFIMVFKFF